MRIKYLPFLAIKRFNIENEKIDKIPDNEILLFIYNQLEIEEFKRMAIKGNKIELEGDYMEMFSRPQPIQDATQFIDFGIIYIERKNAKRTLVYKFQSVKFHIMDIILGIGIYYKTNDILYGIAAFFISFVFFWYWSLHVQSKMVRNCIKKLDRRELFWNKY